MITGFIEPVLQWKKKKEKKVNILFFFVIYTFTFKQQGNFVFTYLSIQMWTKQRTGALCTVSTNCHMTKVSSYFFVFWMLKFVLVGKKTDFNFIETTCMCMFLKN